MKGIVLGIAFALTAPLLVGQTAPHVRVGIVSDWTHRHVLYPDSKDKSAMARARSDPRWAQNWYLRHPGAWWPIRYRRPGQRIRRDWSVALGTTAFEPVFDSSFTFTIGTETGFGTLNLISEGGGTYLATAGSVTVTGTLDVGTFPLLAGGPDVVASPNGAFDYNNLVHPSSDPTVDENGGLLFDNGGGLETNIWGNSTGGDYSFYTSSGSGYPISIQANGSFAFDVASTPDPGGGQTFPAKYVFDVTAAPNCANDFVAIGIPTGPTAGGQANIVGVNNLYSGGAGALCPTGPTVMFAYASGTGQVPAAVTLSRDGTQIAYVENLATGSSYFHVLTIGTTAFEGTSATLAVVPGTGGSNAVDQSVLLSPDGGTTNQSSTNAAFVVYTPNDANDVAYVTTYSMAGSGSGYLYKIRNVFDGGAPPTIIWSVPITAIPSTPVYDVASNNVFFTDSDGHIDYVTDTGMSPPVAYGPVVAAGTTSENAVVVDSVGQMVYASFNTNGTNAVVVQAPTSMASTVSVAVGTGSTVYTSPYEPDFNNDFYTGSGTPLMYVAGTDTTSGTIPTLYSVGFTGGVMNSSPDTSAALATGTADSSPVTEFYNAALGTDYLFVGVTNDCVATTNGGNAGCVMSLDITTGFPTIDPITTSALAAPGGSSGIVVDNDSSVTEASSIYYATKTGKTLVKATQQGLN